MKLENGFIEASAPPAFRSGDHKTKYPKIESSSSIRQQWSILLVLIYCSFCLGSSVSLQGPFFPKVAEKKGATPSEYGLILGVYQLAMFVTSPLFGKMVVWVSPKFMLNAGVMIVGVTLALFGLLDRSPSGSVFLTLGLIVRIMEGIGSVAAKTASYTTVAMLFPDKLATTFASLETAFGIGLLIAPLVGGALHQVGGFFLPFFAIGALLIIGVVMVYFVLPEHGKRSQMKSGDLIKFWANMGIILYATVIFAMYNAILLLQNFMEPHLRQFNFSSLVIGFIFTVGGGSYGFSAPLWGLVAEKTSVNVTYITLFGSFLSLIAFIFIGPASFLPMDTEVWIIMISWSVFGLGCGAKMVSVFIKALGDTLKRGFPDDESTYGLVSSMVAGSSSLGGFIGPAAGGYLIEELGFRKSVDVLFGIELFVILYIILYGVVVSWRTRRQSTDCIDIYEKTPLLSKNGFHRSAVPGEYTSV